MYGVGVSGDLQVSVVVLRGAERWPACHTSLVSHIKKSFSQMFIGYICTLTSSLAHIELPLGLLNRYFILLEIINFISINSDLHKFASYVIYIA